MILTASPAAPNEFGAGGFLFEVAAWIKSLAALSAPPPGLRLSANTAARRTAVLALAAALLRAVPTLSVALLMTVLAVEIGRVARVRMGFG